VRSRNTSPNLINELPAVFFSAGAFRAVKDFRKLNFYKLFSALLLSDRSTVSTRPSTPNVQPYTRKNFK